MSDQTTFRKLTDEELDIAMRSAANNSCAAIVADLRTLPNDLAAYVLAGLLLTARGLCSKDDCTRVTDRYIGMRDRTVN